MATTRHEYVHPIPAYRPRRTRTKTGCLCCRVRRKKCDERKPVCDRCRARGDPCTWPGSDALPPGARSKRSGSGAGSNPLGWPLGRSISTPSPAATVPEECAQDAASVSSDPCDSEALQELSDSPYASVLLEHFVARTSHMLVARDALRNPYLYSVLPMAYSTPLIMHAVLAISGIHMLHGKPSAEVERATYAHYGKAVQELKTRLASWSSESRRETLRLFHTSTLLCTYEVRSTCTCRLCDHRTPLTPLQGLEGNSHGNLVHHLRACGEFAQHIVANDYPEGDRDLIGLSLEVYVYTALLARLQLPTLNEGCGQSSSGRELLSLLRHARQYRTFGSLFGPAHELFELMPEIAQHIWCPRSNTVDCPHHSPPDIYESLQARIESCCGGGVGNNLSTSPQCSMAEYAIGVMVKNSLVMLVRYSRLRHKARLEPAMDEQIQPLIDDNVMLIDMISDGPMSNVSLWPLFVTGSMMRKNDERLALVRTMKKHHTQAPVTSRVVQVLNWLWNDTESEGFGMQAVYRVAERHGAHVCLM